MTQKEALTLEPFDVIVVKGKPGEPNRDALVKSVSEHGVFCLFRIQSTAVLVPFEDIL